MQKNQISEPSNPPPLQRLHNPIAGDTSLFKSPSHAAQGSAGDPCGGTTPLTMASAGLPPNRDSPQPPHLSPPPPYLTASFRAHGLDASSLNPGSKAVSTAHSQPSLPLSMSSQSPSSPLNVSQPPSSPPNMFSQSPFSLLNASSQSPSFPPNVSSQSPSSPLTASAQSPPVPPKALSQSPLASSPSQEKTAQAAYKRQPKTKSKAKGTEKAGDGVAPNPKPTRKPRIKKPVTSTKNTPSSNNADDVEDDDDDPEDNASFREHRIRIGQKKTDFLLAFEPRYRRAKKAKKPKVAVGNLLDAAAGEFTSKFGHLVFTGSRFTPSDVAAELKGTLESSGLETDTIWAIKDNRDECLAETQYIRVVLDQRDLSLTGFIANQSVFPQCILQEGKTSKG
jgi:hypothetical protein